MTLDLTLDTKKQRAAFRELHTSGIFALPNPWNIGTLREIEKLVTPAMNIGVLEAMGVRRVSTGTFLLTPARAAFCAAAKSLVKKGSLPEVCFSVTVHGRSCLKR